MGITKNFFTLEQIRKDDLLEKSGDKMATTDVTLIRHTARAILVHTTVVVSRIVKAKATPWLPKSQVLEPDPIALNLAKVGDELTLVIPIWLAKKNGLTYKETKNEKA